MNEVQDGCCIIDALCGIDTSSPQISQFTDSFDKVKFLLGNNFGEYTLMIITDINGHVEIVHTDDDVLVKETDTDSGETSLLWTIGANITAQSGVIIYQIAAYKKSGDDIEAVWYSKEGRLAVTESIDTTSYSAAVIGAYPNLLTRLITEADANKTSIEELGALKADKSELKAVATSGSYNDLADKPVVDMQYGSESDNAQSGRAVAQAIAALVESAPETLDTLDELASALGDDPNFATTIMTMMGGKVDKADGKGLSANDYTSEEKLKLASIADGAEVNVQPDWEETDAASDSYIKNKPLLSSVATSGIYDDLSGLPELSAVATSGSYADLADTPELSPVATSGSYADLADTPELSAVATSGSYADLADTPELSAVATSGSYADLADTPELSAVATSGSYTDLADTPELSAVATSGSYADLKDTPDIDGKINEALTSALSDVASKKKYFLNGDTVTLSDNTEYMASEEISALTIAYPKTDFICSLTFTLASSGDITITLPESRYIGEIPSFANGETWELSIKNGIVVGGVAE